MNFEELDDTTRSYMLEEFRNEENSENPYRSKDMTSAGKAAFPRLMEEAIKNGNEVTLANALLKSSFWKSTETYYTPKGKLAERKIDPRAAAEKLALTEFNKWYVRGFAKRLMKEGEKQCEVYRAQTAGQPRCECFRYEGQVVDLEKVCYGHRARYWPPGNRSALFIPSGPYCHHTIRRVRK